MIHAAVRRFALSGAVLLGIGGLWLVSGQGLLAAVLSDEPVATTRISGGQVVWSPSVPYESIRLTVSGPDGLVGMGDFPAGSNPAFLAGPNPDGEYSYQLVVAPVLSASVKAQLESATDPAEREALMAELIEDGVIPAQPLTQSGSFVKSGGSFVTASLKGSVGDQDGSGMTETILVAGDAEIQGSLCLGFDCVDAESYGADTLRLKENNLRIHFDDTSASVGFPANDWRIVANDQASGGGNYLAIEDTTAARQIFRVDAGAPANALRVSSTGKVGIGTATPVLDLQPSTGNTPALRLEQTNASGFTAQTWDVAGNEANFFVRDVTSGSLLPFRIRPGAATSSVDIAAAGVGINNGSPTAKLDVIGDLKVRTNSTNTNNILATFENTNTDATSHARIQLKTTGDPDPDPRIDFITPDKNWTMGVNNQSNDFGISTGNNLGGASDALRIDDVTKKVTLLGDLVVQGTINPPSDVNKKEAFAAVNAVEVLEKVATMPVSTWRYKTEDDAVRHIGPTAQDFSQTFGLGASDLSIATVDADGVALAAIQGLNAKLIDSLEQRDALIAQLEARIAALEAAKQE